jgi:hypothetical protein
VSLEMKLLTSYLENYSHPIARALPGPSPRPVASPTKRGRPGKKLALDRGSSNVSLASSSMSDLDPEFAVDTLLSRVPKEFPVASPKDSTVETSTPKTTTMRRKPARAAEADQSTQAQRQASAEIRHSYVKLHLLRAFVNQDGMREVWATLARDGSLRKALRANRHLLNLEEAGDARVAMEILTMLEDVEIEGLLL